MSLHDTPAYYTTTSTIDVQPTAEDCIEGRFFLDETRLVCGAGTAFTDSGYAEKLDQHSASSFQILFGGKIDPQRVRLEEIESKEATISVPFTQITGASLFQWGGSERKGEDSTYAVRVDAPEVVSEPLLIQLGNGERNRGTLKRRHVYLANVLDSHGDADAEPTATASATKSDASDAPSSTEVVESTEESAATTTQTERPSTDSHSDQQQTTAGTAPSVTWLRRFELSQYVLALGPVGLLGYGVVQSGIPTGPDSGPALILLCITAVIGFGGVATRMRWRIGYYLGVWTAGLASTLGVLGLLSSGANATGIFADAFFFTLPVSLVVILIITIPTLFWGANSKPLFYST